MAEWSVQTFKMAMKRMTEALLNQEFHASYLSIGQHHILQLVYFQPSCCLIDMYKHIWICCNQVLVRPLDRTRVSSRWITMLMPGCIISRWGIMSTFEVLMATTTGCLVLLLLGSVHFHLELSLMMIEKSNVT